MEFIHAKFDEFVKMEGELAIILDEGDIEARLDKVLEGRISAMRKAGELAPEEREKADKPDKSPGKRPEKRPEKWIELCRPHGMNASRLWICAHAENTRKAGARLAANASKPVTLYGGQLDDDAMLECAFGFGLRAYQFADYLEKPDDLPTLTLIVEDKDKAKADFAHHEARIKGVHLARDLVHEPANVLNVGEFARRIAGLEELGVEVEILDEKALEKIGMRALLAVGQGSASPSKVAIMRYQGSPESSQNPLLIVGKGVVFDTGGISIKPASGMHEMIMDMGGAATAVGTMATLGARKSPAHVVGIVGLVENMPGSNAQRPGDIVKSLKGDSIEVLNTDAEGRLVLADILWYGQERFEPSAVIDLATLTGAIIIALGHQNAGLFTNNPEFGDKLMAAARSEEEGLWPMPLGADYARLLKSSRADLGNIGGREAGAITAAEFLHRFIKKDTPWAHIDIAGVAMTKSGGHYAPKGATGWGVLTLDRLIQDHYEN